MIAKGIEGSIKKTSLKKLRLHSGVYEWTDAGRLIRNDGPNILYLIFKIINSATSIGVSNLKYEIEKATLANFGGKIKDLLYDMSLNDSILLDKGERREDYVRNIFMDLLLGPRSNLNIFIENNKGHWETET